MNLLSVPQAATRLGVSRSTVYRLIRANLLPTYRVGEAQRIDAGELDLLLRAGALDTKEAV